MAVEARPRFSSLIINFDLGYNEDGKKVTRRRSFSGVKNDAAYQAVFDVAGAISGLQAYPVALVLKRDDTELVEE